MNTKEFNSGEASLSVDLSEARQAVKENRFKDALGLFKIILKKDGLIITLLVHAANEGLSF